MGLGFGCHPGQSVDSGLLWVKLPGGPRAGRGQEAGRKRASGQQVAVALGSPRVASQQPIFIPRCLSPLRPTTTFILEPTSRPLVGEENQPGAPALDLGHSSQ